jgi:leucine dehydrogenase
VLGSDVFDANLRRAVDVHGVRPLAADELLAAEADVFAPCAMGAVLSAKSVDSLRVGIVAGAANNQLADADAANHLLDRGILYCPDFLINSGGIIDVYHQRLGSDSAAVREHVTRIESSLREVLYRAQRSGRSPHFIAESLAREYLAGAADSRQAAAW